MLKKYNEICLQFAAMQLRKIYRICDKITYNYAKSATFRMLYQQKNRPCEYYTGYGILHSEASRYGNVCRFKD